MALAKENLFRLGLRWLFLATAMVACDRPAGKRENGGAACYGGFDLYFILDK